MQYRRHSLVWLCSLCLWSGGCGDDTAVQRTVSEPNQSVTSGEPSPGPPPVNPTSAVVEPIETWMEDRDKIRVFRLEIGQGLQLERSGVITLTAISETEIVLGRELAWRIPVGERGEYHVGSAEYLNVIAVSRDPPYVKLRIRTRHRPAWDLHF